MEAVKPATATLNSCKGLKITNPEIYNHLTTALKEIKGRIKDLTDKRKEITGPIDKAKKAVMDLFRNPINLYTQAENNIKSAMITYTDEQEAARKKEEDRLRREAVAREKKEKEKLKKKAIKADEKGDTDKAEELRDQAEDVKVAAPIMPSNIGKVSGITYKTTWKFKVVDVNKIPREYLIPDEKAIREVVEATKGKLEIEGIEIYSEKSVASGRS